MYNLIRYQAKPEHADRNEDLIRAVFAELHAAAPAGFEYSVFRSEDRVSFLHLFRAEAGGGPGPLGAVRAFGEFQEGIAERCEQAPVRVALTQVGSYRLFGQA